LHPTFIKEDHYLEGLLRKLKELEYAPLTEFLTVRNLFLLDLIQQNTQSFSFRTAICEMMAHYLSPESAETVSRLEPEDFASRILRGYVLSLPVGGRDAAPDLAKYCIVTGFLFRGWITYTKGKEGYPGLVGIVNEANRKRQERLEMLRGPARVEVERIVKSEGFRMKEMAMKVQRNTGVI